MVRFQAQRFECRKRSKASPMNLIMEKLPDVTFVFENSQQTLAVGIE
jgi:hypothetical protein